MIMDSNVMITSGVGSNHHFCGRYVDVDVVEISSVRNVAVQASNNV